MNLSFAPYKAQPSSTEKETKTLEIFHKIYFKKIRERDIQSNVKLASTQILKKVIKTGFFRFFIRTCQSKHLDR